MATWNLIANTLDINQSSHLHNTMFTTVSSSCVLCLALDVQALQASAAAGTVKGPEGGVEVYY